MTPTGARRGRARAVFVAVTCVAVVFTAATAAGAWSTAGAGGGSGRAFVMPAGATPSGTASGTSVTMRWPVATFPNGDAVAGYTVGRYDANGRFTAAGPGCAGVVTTTTCTESNVSPGTWTYVETPVQLSWTGATSPPSQPVTVSS